MEKELKIVIFILSKATEHDVKKIAKQVRTGILT